MNSVSSYRSSPQKQATYISIVGTDPEHIEDNPQTFKIPYPVVKLPPFSQTSDIQSHFSHSVKLQPNDPDFNLQIYRSPPDPDVQSWSHRPNDPDLTRQLLHSSELDVKPQEYWSNDWDNKPPSYLSLVEYDRLSACKSGADVYFDNVRVEERIPGNSRKQFRDFDPTYTSNSTEAGLTDVRTKKSGSYERLQPLNDNIIRCVYEGNISREEIPQKQKVYLGCETRTMMCTDRENTSCGSSSRIGPGLIWSQTSTSERGKSKFNYSSHCKDSRKGKFENDPYQKHPYQCRSLPDIPVSGVYDELVPHLQKVEITHTGEEHKIKIEDKKEHCCQPKKLSSLCRSLRDFLLFVIALGFLLGIVYTIYWVALQMGMLPIGGPALPFVSPAGLNSSDQVTFNIYTTLQNQRK